MQNNTLVYLQSQEAYSNAQKLVKQIEKGDSSLLSKTVTDLKAILTGQQAPVVHLTSLKLIKDLLLTGREEVIRKIEHDLLPLIAQVAGIRSAGGSDQGESYFTNRQEYKKADEPGKEAIRRAGHDYVSMCAQSIQTWAEWMEYTPEGHKSSFSQQYEDLLRRKVDFPTQVRLYKESDRDKFETVYQKMEFFNSESEFEQSILNEANYGAVVSKELTQCQSILESLKCELQPSEASTNWKKVRQNLDRADMFFHDDSVRMNQDLKRLPDSEDSLRRVLEMQSRFGRLIEDYAFYKAGKISYEEFYRNYGTQSVPTPKPSVGLMKNPKQLVLEQQSIHDSVVSQSMKKRQFNNTQAYEGRSPDKTANIFKPSAIVVGMNNEEIEVIRREHKIREDQLKQQYQKLIIQERESTELRVSQLKKLIQANTHELKEEWAKRLAADNELYKQRSEQLLIEARNREAVIQAQNIQIRNLEAELSHTAGSNIDQEQLFKRTQDELIKVKRVNIQLEEAVKAARVRKNSEKDQQVAVQIRSQTSQKTQNNELLATNKKLEKRLDNLTQQNQILKQQLQIERKKNYRATDVQLQLLRDENTRFRQTIAQLEQNITKLKLRIDHIEVDNLKLQQSLKIKMSITETLQKQNQWMTKTMQLPSQPVPVRRLEESLVRSRQSLTPQRKISIRQYLDVTLEGDTYFQELSREFRVRFKRACLKKKELLYKESGIEVGVISEKRASDHVSITVFMTNYGIKDVSDLRIKILNPSTNQISCQTTNYQTFQQGQQQKFFVEAKILSYPMGPFILTISFEDTLLQLLLPITIVRLVSVQDRVEDLKQPSRLNIRYDQKVVSRPDVLRDYFPGVTFTQNAIGEISAKMRAQHHHTYTTFFFDFRKQGDIVELAYEFERGREEIMRYYIRVLASLFEK